MTFWLFIMLVVAFEVAGDVLFKHWSLRQPDDGWALLFVGSVMYACSALAWASTLKVRGLSESTVVFVMATLVAGVVVGYAYGEAVSSRAWLGILLAAAAVWLVEGA